MIRLAAIAALTILFVSSRPALAQNFSPFLGHWKESGISETDDSIFFAVTVRDMDVVIEKIDDTAFRLNWTTITRESGDPDNPDIEKKSASIVFRAAGAPGVYRDEATGDPLKSEPVWWSRVDGTSLYTYMMRINPDGTWVVQKYLRKVTGQGMSLTFERIGDGEQIRKVHGRLVKYAQ